MDWRQVTIVGAGLLGGSIGLAMKARGIPSHRMAWARRQPVVDQCVAMDAFDAATSDLQDAVSGAELVILCVPVSHMAPLCARMAPHLAPDAVVTDVGSVKADVVAALEPIVTRFVGAHPMAGSEQVGLAAASAGLFQGRVCALTPRPGRERDPLVQRVGDFWRALGSEVLVMGPERHDAVVARCSHLPHIVASQLAAAVLRDPEDPLTRAMAGTGFRDTSRLASGSPEMWRDIAQSNRAAILSELSAFEDELQRFREILEEGDPQKLEGYFTRAKVARDAWMDDEHGAA